MCLYVLMDMDNIGDEIQSSVKFLLSHDLLICVILKTALWLMNLSRFGQLVCFNA